MSTFGKFAIEQSFAFLLGLAVVAIVQPTTPGGTALLIITTIALVNVILQMIRLFRRAKGPDT